MENEIEQYIPKTGPLAEACKSVLNTRKIRWNKFLRACKKIPKESPVYGSVSFKAINARRHELIPSQLNSEQTEEYRALCRCVSVGAGAYMAVTLLATKRVLRELNKFAKSLPG